MDPDLEWHWFQKRACSFENKHTVDPDLERHWFQQRACSFEKSYADNVLMRYDMVCWSFDLSRERIAVGITNRFWVLVYLNFIWSKKINNIMSCWAKTRGFSTFCICEQGKLRREFAYAQTGLSLHLLTYTKNGYRLRLGPKLRPLALHDMTAWAVKGGFCVYAISTNILYAGLYNLLITV